MRLRHLTQHACGQRVGLAVVVDVGVQPVHDVEVRVGEQLFQRRVSHAMVDTRRDKTGVIRLARQRGHIGQRGRWRQGSGRHAVGWCGFGCRGLGWCEVDWRGLGRGRSLADGHATPQCRSGPAGRRRSRHAARCNRQGSHRQRQRGYLRHRQHRRFGHRHTLAHLPLAPRPARQEAALVAVLCLASRHGGRRRQRSPGRLNDAGRRRCLGSGL